MSDYQFTNDWFLQAQAPELWLRLKPMLPARFDFLEIGSYEGRSAVWTIENMMDDGGLIVCVDTWNGSAEHQSEDMDAVSSRFDRNAAIAAQRWPDRCLWKRPGSSTFWLQMLPTHLCIDGFDFIYIDGSHVAKDVLTDACMAWPILKPGGVMVFDDYQWPFAPDRLGSPKPAIDAFLDLFSRDLNVLHQGYQVAIQKRHDGA